MRSFITMLALLFIVFNHSAYAERGLNVTHSNSTGKRIALVIGNSGYQNLSSLLFPILDAKAIANTLRGFGFEVIERKDLSLEGMNAAIAEFSRKIDNSEAALFYFSGHGLSLKGQNYLVPVDAQIVEAESQVLTQNININQIQDEMENGKSKVNIVILDACRDNQNSNKLGLSTARGLAPSARQSKSTVVVYPSAPGRIAADQPGRHGLFTTGLLTAFKDDELSLGGVLERTREEVERGSNNFQTPYINGSATLLKDFQFANTR